MSQVEAATPHTNAGAAKLSAADRQAILFETGIFGLCEALHGARIGISDPMRPAEGDEILDYLESRLRGWTVGPPETKPYDDCVRALVEATLREYGR